MNRTSFPVGQVSSAFAKALLRRLEAAKGRATANVWLAASRIARDDLEDETRSMSLPTLHDALVAFVSAQSREAIPEAWRELTTPDVLGFWMRILRGTSEPVDAFARLDEAEADHARTTRWETLSTSAGTWRGRVHIAHDPRIEQDGLLGLLRAAMLGAVPVLFGFDRGRVNSNAGTANVEGSSELAQEFTVRWKVPSVVKTGGVGMLGGALTSSVAVLTSASLGLPPAVGAGVVGAVTFAGAFGSAYWARDRLRRAESFAQRTRVLALERNLALKEGRERKVAGEVDGTLIAAQYRIKRRMGAGASGVIYEAVRERDGLPVAVKLLRAAAAHDAVASDRLRREAAALGLAWHPNVVEVIDHGHLPDGTAYLAMELLEGESLATRLQSRRRLGPEELLPIATQVCDALAAIHAAGVVHRDLKPSNIFLARLPDGSERVKILDFGIARVEWEETRITNIGAPLGTPGYMSPEQELGGEVDARTDLYAVGALLFECLTGSPPPSVVVSGMYRAGRTPGAGVPNARTPVSGASALKGGAPGAAGPGSAGGTSATVGSASTPGSVARRLESLPPGWRAVIERAVAPFPGDRFADARVMAQALRALNRATAGAVPS